MAFRRGRVIQVHDAPAWARALYGQELQRFSPGRERHPGASFAEAGNVTRAVLHEHARTIIAGRGHRYTGAVIGETALHTLQQIDGNTVVAHFAARLPIRLAMGERATVMYDRDGEVVLHREAERGPYAAAADAWQRNPAKAAETFPEHDNTFATASAMLLAAHTGLKRRGLVRAHIDRVAGKLRGRLARAIESGEPLARTQGRSKPNNGGSGR